MYYKKNVDYVELLWEDFTYQIDNKAHKKQEKMYYPQFIKVIIHYFLAKDKTVSWRNKIGMHTSMDDYMINTLRFIFANEESQIYGARLPESMTISPEEPTRKSKRVKRPAKKSTNVPTAGVVIRDTLVMSLSKKKEKTHPSGSGIVTKIAPSAAKIKPSVTNEGISAKPGVLDVTKEESTKRSDSEHETNENETGFESDQEENEEEVEDDKEEKDNEFVKTPSNYTDDEDETNVESKVEDNAEVNIDEGFIQKEGTDAEMINKTEVPVTKSSHSSDLASKFLKFLDIPHTDAEIVSPMDVHVHHEVPSNQTPTLLTVPVSIITESSPSLRLEKEVAELKKDDLLNTQMTALVDEHLDSRLGATRDEFMSNLSASITTKITEQVKIQLPQILPKEVSNFGPPVIKSMVTESLEQVV
ncbi:hypothetical protein Tco_0862473 [Tanacetum coccineum]